MTARRRPPFGRRAADARRAAERAALAATDWTKFAEAVAGRTFADVRRAAVGRSGDAAKGPPAR